jgi:hypothetical protein
MLLLSLCPKFKTQNPRIKCPEGAKYAKPRATPWVNEHHDGSFSPERAKQSVIDVKR